MIIPQVRRTIQERRLIDKGMRVLVACSGGPDSTAMLYALAQLAPELGFSMVGASVDHGLRQAAAQEVELAGRQARSLGIGFFPLKIEVRAGPSVQAEARAARYAALKQLADKLGARRIAVGHTRDDQAETVVMRIMRGAGLEGLGGIAPRRADGVIRPLIDCPRSEVHAFALRSYPEIADDPSNFDPRFERVRVRNRLMPVLEAENPAFRQHLADLADESRKSARLTALRARRLLRKAVSQGERGDSLHCPMLRLADPATRRAALRFWIRRQTGIDPGRSHIDQLDKALGGGGEIWLPDGWAVSVSGGLLTCVPR